jgi:hypothetical protein
VVLGTERLAATTAGATVTGALTVTGAASIGGGVTASGAILTTVGAVTAKPVGSAGIAINPNGATGNFTLSLVPANLTADRTITFPDATGTVVASTGLTNGRIPYASGGLLTDSSLLTFDAAPTIGGVVVGNTTVSTSPTTGALLVAGGVGVAGAVYANGLASASLTPGSVVFAGAGGLLSQNNTAFFWDATNGRLGIGTNAPTYPLVVKVATAGFAFDAGTQNLGTLFGRNGGIGIYAEAPGSPTGPFLLMGGSNRADERRSSIQFWVNAVEYMRIDGDAPFHVLGNVGIGTSFPTGRLSLIGAVTASADTGFFAVGPTDSYFSGVGGTRFIGSASGTQFAINAVAGFAGNLVDWQVTGSSQFSVSASGTATMFGIIARGSAAPAVSSAGTGRIYFDSAANVFRVSENGGAFVNLVGAGSGTVTSVGLSMPGIFNVSGSPVTASGTLTATLANQSANTVFAGPTTGSPAAPTFRSLVAADIPALAASSITGTNSQVAFFSGGVLGGSANLTWDGSTFTVTGKLTVTGLIDPTGVAYTPVAANPGGALAASTFWVNSVGTVPTFGSTPLAIDSSVVHITGTEMVTGAKTFSAATTVSNTTASASNTTGALVVAGGVGVGGRSVFDTGSGTMPGLLGTSVLALSASVAPRLEMEAFGTGAEIWSRCSGGTRGAPSATPDGIILLQVNAFGWDNAGALASPSASYIVFSQGAYVSGSNRSAYHAFYGVPASSVTASEWVRFQDANLRIMRGAIDVVGISAPSVSDFGSGKIYFDSSTNVFRVSQNGGAYVNLVGGGSPAGSNTQIQFNNAGSFGASTNLTWNGTILHTAGMVRVNGSFDVVGTASQPVSASGSGTIYFDSGINKFVVSENGGAYVSLIGSGSGTVTSVGLSMPGIFNVSGSPVTASGTLTATLANQSANAVFAGPTTGSPAAPTFRSMVLADLPTISSVRLLGRTAAGSGAPEQIQIGAGLSLSGGFLSATGGATPGGPNEAIQFNNSGSFGGTANLTWSLSILAVNGLVAPTGVQLSGQPFNPSGFSPATTLWANSSDSYRLYYGSLPVPTGAAGLDREVQFNSSGSFSSSSKFTFLDGGFPYTDGCLAVSQDTNVNPSLRFNSTALLVQSIGGSGVSVQVNSFGASAGSYIYGGAFGGAPGSPSATSAGQVLLGMVGVGSDNGFGVGGGAAISMIASNNWTGSNLTAHISLSTTNLTAYAERMRLYGDGGLQLGGTFGTSPGAGSLQTSGAVSIGTSLTQTGMAAPAVSPAGRGRIYFDSTANVFRVSENGGAYVNLVGGGAGTVTSVGLSLPGIFSVSGSPVTTSGTLTAALVSQSANTVFAAPDGSAGTPTFRALVSADIPGLPWSKITSGTPTTRAGYGIVDAAGNGAVTLSGITMNTARLLGRSSAGTGAVEEITLGAGLTLSGGILSAASGTAYDRYSQLTNSIISITAATTLTVSDVNKLHRISGTTANYSIALPPPGAAGGWIGFYVDSYANANKVYRLTGAVVWDNYVSGVALVATNCCTFVSDGTNWVATDMCLDTAWYAVSGGVAGNLTAVGGGVSAGTVTVDVFRWRRVGHAMEFEYSFTKTTGGADGSGDYLLALPLGESLASWVNTNNSVNVHSLGQTFGNCVINTLGVSDGNGCVEAYDSTHVRFWFHIGTGYGHWGSALFGLGLNNPVITSGRAVCPLQDW